MIINFSFYIYIDRYRFFILFLFTYENRTNKNKGYTDYKGNLLQPIKNKKIRDSILKLSKIKKTVPFFHRLYHFSWATAIGSKM